jgi:hypothetical protein
MEETIQIKYSANVTEFEQQVNEIIQLAEKLRARLSDLGVKVEVIETSQC